MNHFIIRPTNDKRLESITDVSRQQIRIQEARLFAALLESGWGLKVNSLQVESIKEINPYFPITISKYSGETTHDIPITIDHAVPRTRFGHVERPLVFPTWLANVGLPITPKRDYFITFQGFPTKKRVISTLRFFDKNLGIINPHIRNLILIINLLFQSGLRTKMLNLLYSRFYIDKTIMFSWSMAGRTITHKIIDVEYWNVLHRSLMVYCPDGDFIWTYRFYEAILAGALPILDGNADRAFTRSFATLNSVKDMSNPKAVKRDIINNRAYAFQLLTAKDELKPGHFDI